MQKTTSQIKEIITSIQAEIDQQVTALSVAVAHPILPMEGRHRNVQVGQMDLMALDRPVSLAHQGAQSHPQKLIIMSKAPQPSS